YEGSTMRKKWIPLLVLGFLAFVAVGGLVVRQLWDRLLPPPLRAPTITFWQAPRLPALSRILFRGFGGGGRRSGGRRWGRRAPEERERLRHGVSGYPGGASTPTVI